MVMNMPTNEERREIARNLREAKARCEERGYPWMCDDLILSLGYTHDYEAGNEIFDLLADLIEPEPERTCRNVSKDDHEFECSECGEWLDIANVMSWMHMKPNYCPNCGAKVVYDVS